jgi:hypothetical protein
MNKNAIVILIICVALLLTGCITHGEAPAAGEILQTLRNRNDLFRALDYVLQTTDIGERIPDNLVQCNDDRKLQKQGQTAAERAIAFLLIHFLDLLLHLHFGVLIFSAFVFLFNGHLLWLQFCLLDGIFLLIDGEREENDLKQQSK